MSEIFNQIDDDAAEDAAREPKLKPLTHDDVEKIANNYMDECVDFRDSELQQPRVRIDKYYRGETDLPLVDGRSQVVVTKVRDGVKSVIPSLARIFMQTDTVGEFYSDDEEDQALCKDATLYCNNVFWKYDGYRALISAAIDSLKAKVGIIKVSLENKQIVSHLNYNAGIIKEGEVELDNITEANDEELVQTNTSTRKVWSFTPIPPEEFLIHPTATSVENAVACAHERELSLSDLVEMGFDFDEIKDIPAAGDSINYEDSERKGYDRNKDDGSSPAIDPTSKRVVFVEAYIRVDADGDGIAELRRLSLVGPQRKLLADEPVNYAPFAEFYSELQPHVFYPICLAEDLIQDQDAATALFRSIIDNTALTNNPRTVINERMVNVDDAKNNKLGAIIRAKDPTQILELATPFVAGATLPVLQYLGEVSEQRSGITKLSQGLNPDSLQSTTQIAAQAAVNASDARIEMMARNIAETGVKSLFKCMLKTAIYNITDSQSIQLPEGFKRVNPSQWHMYLNVRVNVGLGSGRIDEKKQALNALLPIQQMLIEKMGVANPISNWNNARETIKTVLRLNGVHDYQTYFPYVSPDVLQQMDKSMQEKNAELQKMQQDAQKAQQSAMLELVKVEAQKSSLKYETDIAKIKSDSQTNMIKLQSSYDAQIQKLQMQIAEMQSKARLDATDMLLKDDRERDKMDMDFAVDTAKVGLEEKKIAATEAKVAADRENKVLQ